MKGDDKMDLRELEERGYEDATNRFLYINPNWSKDQVNAWAKGFWKGIRGDGKEEKCQDSSR